MRVTPYLLAAAIGVLNGLRTFTAPAATARAGGSPWTGLLTTLALGELVADKLPAAPSRLEPPGLGARAVAGALCGGSVAARGSGARGAGMVAGASAAVFGAWLGYTVRHYLTTDANLPDVAVALVEDGVAIAGSVLVNSLATGG